MMGSVSSIDVQRHFANLCRFAPVGRGKIITDMMCKISGRANGSGSGSEERLLGLGRDSKCSASETQVTRIWWREPRYMRSDQAGNDPCGRVDTRLVSRGGYARSEDPPQGHAGVPSRGLYTQLRSRQEPVSFATAQTHDILRPWQFFLDDDFQQLSRAILQCIYSLVAKLHWRIFGPRETSAYVPEHSRGCRSRQASLLRRPIAPVLLLSTSPLCKDQKEDGLLRNSNLERLPSGIRQKRASTSWQPNGAYDAGMLVVTIGIFPPPGSEIEFPEVLREVKVRTWGMPGVSAGQREPTLQKQSQADPQLSQTAETGHFGTLKTYGRRRDLPLADRIVA
ncbi:hypothetical protein JHW43_001912 [Diplocarpon mali]|nr:hypothetical protein JHW43_001912 [Diplocarpon mali]